MKKILALIMAALLIFCMVSCSKEKEDPTDEATTPLGAQKDVVSDATGTFAYGINANGDYEITDYTPASVAIVDVTLPTVTADGREISAIGENAFKAENSIKSITIPSTYTYIGNYAFYDCDALESVTMTDSVVEIAEGAFQACDVLTTVTMSKSVKIVGANAFKDCVALTSIDLSGAVEAVAEGAFMGCAKLASIKLSDNITDIAKTSFMNCSTLEYKIENGGKYLGNDANPYLVLVAAETLNIEECIVNDTTKVIAKGALSNCPELEKLVLGKAVTVVDIYCFENSPAIEYTEYENIRYLGTADNPHMVAMSVILTACENLTFHEDVKLITADTLDGCNDLITITYPKTEADWNAVVKAEEWLGDLVVEYFFAEEAAE